MGGMTMWIVLGALIALVAVFLIVTSILDRKKTKKLKIKSAQMKLETDQASTKVLLFLNYVTEQNAQLLKEFVPSVGKLKMSDIKNKSKESLKLLRHSSEYKILTTDEDHDKLVASIQKLSSINSNSWPQAKELQFVIKGLKDVKPEEFEDYLKEVKEKLGAIY